MEGNRQNRSLFLKLLIVATLCAILLAIVCGDHAIVEAVFVGQTGTVTNPSDWPEPLKKLCDESKVMAIPTSTIQVHCLCHGMDYEYVWRMEATPGLFDHIKNRWELSPVSDPHWRVLDGTSSLSGESTPSWWSPSRDRNTMFYACRRSLAGEKGDRFQVALDKHRNVVFVHYWFNF